MDLEPEGAPRAGFEPTTYRLTAGRSTVELAGKGGRVFAPRLVIYLVYFSPSSERRYSKAKSNGYRAMLGLRKPRIEEARPGNSRPGHQPTSLN
jgi:hypothetical protein